MMPQVLFVLLLLECCDWESVCIVIEYFMANIPWYLLFCYICKYDYFPFIELINRGAVTWTDKPDFVSIFCEAFPLVRAPNSLILPDVSMKSFFKKCCLMPSTAAWEKDEFSCLLIIATEEMFRRVFRACCRQNTATTVLAQ